MAKKEYIEREALLNETSGIKMNGNTYRVAFYDDIIFVPAADVVPVRHGHWIEEYLGYGVYRYVCSLCKSRVNEAEIKDFGHNRFCSVCGAKMDGREKNNA